MPAEFDALTIATALAGLLAPVITYILTRIRDTDHKRIVSLAISIVIGVVALLAVGGFADAGWGVNLLAIVGASQAIYTLIVKPIDDKVGAARADE